MKITQRQLKKIIKEEKLKLHEGAYLSPQSPEYDEALMDLEDELKNAIARALEKGLIDDDLTDAWENAKQYVTEMEYGR